MNQYTPRLSVEISPEDSKKLRKLFPHGTQKIVFNLIIQDLISTMEELGAGKVIGAYISRDITLKDISKTIIE